MKKKQLKKSKNIWSKEMTLDSTYKLGLHLGARRAFEILVEESFIDEKSIAWLLEEKFIKRLLKS